MVNKLKRSGGILRNAPYFKIYIKILNEMENKKRTWLFLLVTLPIIVISTLSSIPAVVGQALVDSVKSDMPLHKLYGKWRFTEQPDRSYEYLPDSVAIFRVEKVNEKEEERLRYWITAVNDTLYLSLKHEFRPEERYAMRISGDYKVDFSFKRGEGINSHVDEYFLMVRDSVEYPRPFDDGLPITKFVLPQGFRGHVVIAFNQPDGVVPTYDAKGNCIVSIPHSGVLKTQLKEDVFGVARRRYGIVICDSVTKQSTELPSLHRFEFFYGQNLPQGLSVIVEGFNQLQRGDLNRLFKQRVNGNVLMFYVLDDVKTEYENAKSGKQCFMTPWF